MISSTPRTQELLPIKFPVSQLHKSMRYHGSRHIRRRRGYCTDKLIGSPVGGPRHPARVRRIRRA